MRASLIFGGDVAPLRGNPRNMFGELTETIHGADLAVANLEFALSDCGRPVRGKIYPHRGPASALAGLTEAGFDALNLANNHMLDYGEEPLLDTLDALGEASIAAFGAGRDANEAGRPAVLERGGLKIGLLGFTTTLPRGFAATEDGPGVNPFRVVTSYRPFRDVEEYPGSPAIIETRAVPEDLAALVAGIKALKADTDLVLVYAHWGTSMTEAVHDFQREIGHAAIDAGAAAVFGGHQHVVSAIEFHRGCPIVHGLGNLVFDFVAPFFSEATQRAIVFSADMTRHGLEHCRLICCRTGVNAPVARLNSEVGEGAVIAATLKRLSEPLGTVFAVHRDHIDVKPQA